MFSMGLKVIWQWIFRDNYSDTALCIGCGDRGHKTRMYRDRVAGWFCDEKEYIAFWDGSQW